MQRSGAVISAPVIRRPTHRSFVAADVLVAGANLNAVGLPPVELNAPTGLVRPVLMDDACRIIYLGTR